MLPRLLMSQHYSNPDREHEPTALPDIEVFYLSKADAIAADGTYQDDDLNEQPVTEPGFYWHFCFPGCLPDSDPNGPFQTKAEALADAQSNND